jgi:hypothetical protein
MYSFQSNSDWIIFITRHVKLDCIYSLQLSSVATNRDAKQYVVIRDIKTRYMPWPGIKYPVYSFRSISD